jgi:hypothetical protein
MKKNLFRMVNPAPRDGCALPSPKDTTPEPCEGPVPEPWPVTDVAMLTIPRSSVHYSLASLLMSGAGGDIFLVAGRPEIEYLQCYAHHERVHICQFDEASWSGMANKPNGWLACYNYLRALSTSDNNLLVCEDDVVFADGWQTAMSALIDEIENTDRNGQYFFTLYSPTMVTTRTKRNHSRFPYHLYAGAQAMYLPRRIVQPIRDVFRNALAMSIYESEIKPDILINIVATERSIPIFTPKHSLVQHIGTSSTMTSTYHRSPTFVKRKQPMTLQVDLREPIHGLNYVIAGTGRCGTVYMARLLSSLGIMCGHESVFNKTGPQPLATLTSYASTHDDTTELDSWFDPFIRQAESSWMAVPYLHHPLARKAKIIHLIREPMKVISSMLCKNLLEFTAQDHLSEYRNFILKHLPDITDVSGDINRAAYFYLHWNDRISQSRPDAILQRIEDQPQRFIKMLGSEPAGPIYDNKNANHQANHETDLDFDAITDPRLREQIIEFSERHGYIRQ